ncbi:hypothetical protein BDU57DRAFT_524840 [Ampelomyces quisqualis]|uniref:Uncharacterized protein n=1 Tax=Ampelomyces quisqualis TaxID=50730 RepID=A0A6A5Q665_AMPQU|nr:hypothetical protein BDU57DRAFT_524840 [Ampelomyces quisqualis]
MIRESPTEITEEVDSLKQALAAAQLELAKQIARADTAEKAMVHDKNIYEKNLAGERRRTEAVAQSGKDVKASLQKYLANKSAMLAICQADLDRCRRRNDHIFQENKRASMTLASEKERVTKELEIKDKELQAARAEADVAKKQISDIRDEMKKAKKIKKEAGCDLFNEREKRVKVE